MRERCEHFNEVRICCAITSFCFEVAFSFDRSRARAMYAFQWDVSLFMCHANVWVSNLGLVRCRSTGTERERIEHFNEVRDEVCVFDVS